MRKAGSLLLVLVLLTGLCSGCADGKITKNKISYDYEQELHIIDDNYRNYYEIFVYSFYDSDGNGIGDLQGVIQKLDYVEYMGFNGIWLMPIMQSNSYHKYDVLDYKSIDRSYGNLEDFKQLVEECHKRGIRLVVDMVINHTASGHPWFKEACDYLRGLGEGQEPNLTECPYVGYYNFAKEKVNGTYYPVSGLQGWYYEGSFWSEMPDLNLNNEEVRKELEEIADFWIDLGVDGFRMDGAAHFTEYDNEANTEVLKWFFGYCKEKNPDFYMVSEVWAGLSAIAQYYGSQSPSMFNFDAGQAEGILASVAKGSRKATDLVERMLMYQTEFSAQNENYIDAPFLTNHDMVRISNALANKEDNLKMAAGLLMMMNGNPFVYYGEEIGMASKGTKDESKRIAMFWSEKDTEGMTRNPSGADLGIKSAFAAVDEQEKDGHSLLNYYRRAIRLRNENPEIARGTIAKIASLCNGHQAAITKTWEGSTIAIIYNTAAEDAEINIGASELADMGIRGYLTLNGEKITLKNGILKMPAKSICILKQGE